ERERPGMHRPCKLSSGSTLLRLWHGADQANHLQSNAVHPWGNFARKCNCDCFSLQIGSVPRDLMHLSSKLCYPGFKQLERSPPKRSQA
ncbi:MAG: hypothetical protein ACK55Z_07480, partial [bacterium]